ncbi:MAG: hypothetical protein K0Q59_4835 [Paenibacillus sp.]|jgi:ribosomal protein L32|nr:hypothetical protein [Paenibacillus sp.]
MYNKLAVQFRRSQKTTTAYERLKSCKSCGSYTVLFDNRCKKCGAKDKLVPIEQYASSLNRILPWAELFAGVGLVLLAVVCANTLLQLAVAAIGGMALLALFLLLRNHYKPYAEKYRMQKLLIDRTQAIWQGLQADQQDAVNDMEADKPKDAYEKLREVSWFIRSDSLKARKLACLKRFIIRKDMDLELEQVVPTHFSEVFVEYMGEALKVNKQLLRQSVLDYAVANRSRIEMLHNGKEIMALVAGAALRMKKYVYAHPQLIYDYLDELPRERFHRLCTILASIPIEQRGRLYDKSKETAATRYAFDPEFQGILE